ncbi:MAG: hypothetical protein ABMB14_14235, partial [Myxococcota bacterium]
MATSAGATNTLPPPPGAQVGPRAGAPSERPTSVWSSPFAVQMGCLLFLTIGLAVTWVATALALLLRVVMG